MKDPVKNPLQKEDMNVIETYPQRREDIENEDTFQDVDKNNKGANWRNERWEKRQIKSLSPRQEKTKSLSWKGKEDEAIDIGVDEELEEEKVE